MENAEFAFLFKVKSVSFLLISSDYGDIWQKKPSKIENKTQPANMAATEPADFHTTTSTEYIGMFFLQPDVLKT
jgi:hypothetical protein